MKLTIPTYRPEAIYHGSQRFAVDGETSTLVITASTDKKTDEKTLQAFCRALQDFRLGKASLTQEEKFRLVGSADLYLKTMVKQYQTKLSLGLKACKSDPLLMSICKLDRLVTAEKFPVLLSDTPIDADGIKPLYATQVSKDLLDKWIKEPTHAGRKIEAPTLSERVVNSEYAAEAFLHHPEEVDFLMDSYLYKQVARLNEHIEIDPVTKHHIITCEGKKEVVDSLDGRFTIDKEGKLLDGSKRYAFCHTQGIVAYDPENWNELPVFRERKHARSDDDYRLVIKTIENGENHAWIELKSPTSVHNVGYFWDTRDEEKLFTIRRFVTVRGKLHSVDKNELVGKEKDVMKTVCAISKEQFEALKAQIESFQNQKQPKVFNILSNNCTAWACKLLSTIGLSVASKENVSRYLYRKHFTFTHPEYSTIGKIERIFHRGLSILRNIAIYFAGGAYSYVEGADVSEYMPFRSFSDVFDHKRGLCDHPQRVRDWQKAVMAHRQEQIKRLEESKEFSEMTTEQQQQALETAKYAIPLEVKLPDPEITL